MENPAAVLAVAVLAVAPVVAQAEVPAVAAPVVAVVLVVAVVQAAVVPAVVVPAVVVPAVVVPAVVVPEASFPAVVRVVPFSYLQQAASSTDAPWIHVRLPIWLDTLRDVHVELRWHWAVHLAASKMLCRTCTTGQ